MNNISIVGNITRDPEIRMTQSGTPSAIFSVAVRRDYKNSQTGQYDTDFFNCVAWRQSAEYLKLYAKKGAKIAITGKMQFRKYTAQDGSERPIWELIVERAELLRTAGGGETPAARTEQSGERADDFEEVADDDLPF